MRKILIITIFAVLSSSAFAFNIVIEGNSEPMIDYFYWFNMSQEDGFQKYTIVWENIGSVTCKTRIGVFVYEHDEYSLLTKVADNIKDLKHVSWSSEFISIAGSVNNIELYSPMNVGEYSVQIKVYYCNDVYNFGFYDINITDTVIPNNQTIIINSVDVGENKMDIKYLSRNSYENVYIYPKNYPYGWVVEQNVTKNVEENKEYTATIYYERILDKPEYVNIRFASDDLTAITDHEIYVVKKEFDTRTAYVIILSVIVFVCMFVLNKLRKRSKNPEAIHSERNRKHKSSKSDF